MSMTQRASLGAAAVKRRLKGKDVGIPIRRLRQDYSDLPTYWFADNALLTAYFAAFSATLPEGEAQFIHSVRLFQDKITDPVLLAQVRAFIAQEAHHSKAHQAFNDAMQARGFPVAQIDARMREMNAHVRKHQSPAEQLAGTVCGEHITALMSDWALRKRPEVLDMLAPEARALWAWHSVEETEHKAVAFDVYDQLVGDRNLLRRAMLETTVMFVAFTTYNALKVLLRSKQRGRFRTWREAISVMGSLARDSWSDYLDFYRRDYHPWQHDNQRALAAAKHRFLGEPA